MNLHPTMFGKSPCCGNLCSGVKATEDRGKWHVRLEFWHDRHDKHVWVTAETEDELVARVNGKLS